MLILFAGSPITEFIVDSQNTHYTTIDKVLYTTNYRTLVAYPIGDTRESYTVHPNTIVIGTYSFLRGKIKNVYMPEGLRTIDGGAFEATTLIDVTVPSTVEKIVWFAFSNSAERSLKYVRLKVGDNVVISEDSTFKGMAQNSIIYTESKEVADKFVPDATYTAARTEVYYPFKVTSAYETIEVERGNTLTIAPTIRAGYVADDVVYQWYKDGAEIPGATSTSYTKSGFANSDIGEYSLRIRSAIQEDGTYYYDRTVAVANVIKLDLTGPESISTSVAYNEDGTATVTITVSDQDSGIDTVTVSGDLIPLTKDDSTFSAVGNVVIDEKGEYEIVATDDAGNSSTTTINAYEIVYNANALSTEFTGTTLRQIKIEDVAITLRNNGFTKIGNTFNSWNTSSDGSGLRYLEGSTYSANADVTMYAIWSFNSYVVRFYNNNGISGDVLVSEATYNFGDLITVPGTQQRAGMVVDSNTYRIFVHNGEWTPVQSNPDSSMHAEEITGANADSIRMIDSNVNYYAKYESTDVSNTEATVIINEDSEIEGTTRGIHNYMGQVIIGNRSTEALKPTIKGQIAILNDSGLVRVIHGIIDGIVSGILTP